MAKIRMPCPARDDQIVVLDPGAIGKEHGVLFLFEADHLAQYDLNVFVFVKYSPNRLGDLAGAQHRGRDLVKQRLEDVMVLTVDQREVDGPVCERLRSPQAAEAAADNHDSWPICH